jgi:hypothetical protein
MRRLMYDVLRTKGRYIPRHTEEGKEEDELRGVPKLDYQRPGQRPGPGATRFTADGRPTSGPPEKFAPERFEQVFEEWNNERKKMQDSS